MTTRAEKLERRAGRERKPTHADLELARLRTTPIGPAFPEGQTSPRGTRKAARGGKDTKPPYSKAKP